eukprot:4245947-Amphidinium_carterae.1
MNRRYLGIEASTPAPPMPSHSSHQFFSYSLQRKNALMPPARSRTQLRRQTHSSQQSQQTHGQAFTTKCKTTRSLSTEFQRDRAAQAPGLLLIRRGMLGKMGHSLGGGWMTISPWGKDSP